jgi:hypothetical protein
LEIRNRQEKALIWYGVTLSLIDPNDTGNVAKNKPFLIARIAGWIDVLWYFEMAEGEN